MVRELKKRKNLRARRRRRSQEQRAKSAASSSRLPTRAGEVGAVPIEQAHRPDQQAGGEREKAAPAFRAPPLAGIPQHGEQKEEEKRQSQETAAAGDEKSDEAGQDQKVREPGRDFFRHGARAYNSFSSMAWARSRVFIFSRPVSARASWNMMEQ